MPEAFQGAPRSDRNRQQSNYRLRAAGFQLVRACRAGFIRICTEEKINVVVKLQRLSVARKNARSTISRTVDGRPQHQFLEGVF
jgi:hypothetical protein